MVTVRGVHSRLIGPRQDGELSQVERLTGELSTLCQALLVSIQKEKLQEQSRQSRQNIMPSVSVYPTLSGFAKPAADIITSLSKKEERYKMLQEAQHKVLTNGMQCIPNLCSS